EDGAGGKTAAQAGRAPGGAGLAQDGGDGPGATRRREGVFVEADKTYRRAAGVRQGARVMAALKYAFWPGCVSKGAAPELYLATNLVAAELGIELVELEQATCTGAGIIQEQNPELADALNARTFALAQQMGLPLMNI